MYVRDARGGMRPVLVDANQVPQNTGYSKSGWTQKTTTTTRQTVNDSGRLTPGRHGGLLITRKDSLTDLRTPSVFDTLPRGDIGGKPRLTERNLSTSRLSIPQSNLSGSITNLKSASRSSSLRRRSQRRHSDDDSPGGVEEVYRYRNRSTSGSRARRRQRQPSGSRVQVHQQSLASGSLRGSRGRLMDDNISIVSEPIIRNGGDVRSISRGPTPAGRASVYSSTGSGMYGSRSHLIPQPEAALRHSQGRLAESDIYRHSSMGRMTPSAGDMYNNYSVRSRGVTPTPQQQHYGERSSVASQSMRSSRLQLNTPTPGGEVTAVDPELKEAEKDGNQYYISMNLNAALTRPGFDGSMNNLDQIDDYSMNGSRANLANGRDSRADDGGYYGDQGFHKSRINVVDYDAVIPSRPSSRSVSVLQLTRDQDLNSMYRSRSVLDGYLTDGAVAEDSYIVKSVRATKSRPSSQMSAYMRRSQERLSGDEKVEFDLELLGLNGGGGAKQIIVTDDSINRSNARYTPSRQGANTSLSEYTYQETMNGRQSATGRQSAMFAAGPEPRFTMKLNDTLLMDYLPNEDQEIYEESWKGSETSDARRRRRSHRTISDDEESRSRSRGKDPDEEKRRLEESLEEERRRLEREREAVDAEKRKAEDERKKAEAERRRLELEWERQRQLEREEQKRRDKEAEKKRLEEEAEKERNRRRKELEAEKEREKEAAMRKMLEDLEKERERLEQEKEMERRRRQQELERERERERKRLDEEREREKQRLADEAERRRRREQEEKERQDRLKAEELERERRRKQEERDRERKRLEDEEREKARKKKEAEQRERERRKWEEEERERERKRKEEAERERRRQEEEERERERREQERKRREAEEARRTEEEDRRRKELEKQREREEQERKKKEAEEARRKWEEEDRERERQRELEREREMERERERMEREREKEERYRGPNEDELIQVNRLKLSRAPPDDYDDNVDFGTSVEINRAGGSEDGPDESWVKQRAMDFSRRLPASKETSGFVKRLMKDAPPHSVIQTVHVEREEEEIKGPLPTKTEGLLNLDTVSEKVNMTLEDGWAELTVKVRCERIVPIRGANDLYKKSSVIVSRIIDVDLTVTQERRDLYEQVMDNRRDGNKLSNEDTFELYKAFMELAEAEEALGGGAPPVDQKIRIDKKVDEERFLDLQRERKAYGRPGDQDLVGLYEPGIASADFDTDDFAENRRMKSRITSRSPATSTRGPSGAGRRNGKKYSRRSSGGPGARRHALDSDTSSLR